MALVNAKDARQATKPSASADMSVEEYLNSRIQQALDDGFSTTFVWVKNKSEAEVLRLLNAGGYDYEVRTAEPNSKQYRISW